MKEYSTFIGMDVHKNSIEIAIAQRGRTSDPAGSSANVKPKVDKTHLQPEVIYKAWPVFQTGGHTYPRVLAGLHAYHSQ